MPKQPAMPTKPTRRTQARLRVVKPRHRANIIIPKWDGPFIVNEFFEHLACLRDTEPRAWFVLSPGMKASLEAYERWRDHCAALEREATRDLAQAA